METQDGKNTKYLSGVSSYVISSADDFILVDTSAGPVALYLPNIVGSGLTFKTKKFYIGDNTGNAATNNITIYPSGNNQVNSGVSVVLNTNGATCECVISSQTEYLINKDSAGSAATPNLQQVTTAGATTNLAIVTAGLTLSNMTAGSIPYFGTAGIVSQNNSNLFWDNSNILFYVGGNSGAFSNTKIQVKDNTNTLSQINFQNISAGATASGDICVTADTGTNTTNFVNIGINSSGNTDATFTIATALDSYLYSNGGKLVIGTSTAKDIVFFTGGTLAANEVFRFTNAATGATALATVKGSVTAASSIAKAFAVTTTVTAAANGDVLYGGFMNPTFSNGAFTGVTNYALGLSGGGLRIITGSIPNSGIVIRDITTTATSGGIYIGKTPDGTNYSLGADNAGSTFLNFPVGGATIFQSNGATTLGSISDIRWSLQPGAATSGSQNAFRVLCPNSTALTASTDVPSVQFTMPTNLQFSTGAQTTMRLFNISQSTIRFVGASSATLTANVNIQGAVSAGTNSTVTTTTALNIESFAVNGSSTPTNSFAIIANAMTGATNNYVANFLGGNTIFAACVTGYASINLPHGTTPTTLLNGDIWTTTAGLFCRINGVTKTVTLT